jgi:hypothetical protein
MSCLCFVLIEVYCTIHYRIQLTAFGASHHTGDCSHVVSRGCAGEQMDSVCKH